MATISSLEEIYVAQLRELLSAEIQSAPVLIMLLDATTDPELAEMFQRHYLETLGQAERLERLLAELGHGARDADCEAIGALVREAQKAAGEQTSPVARDLALIGAAQRIEHFEMACYGSVRTYATVLDHEEAAARLQEILDQESQAEWRLAEVAKRLNAELPDNPPVIAAF